MQPLNRNSLRYIQEKSLGKLIISIRKGDTMYFSKAVVEQGKIANGKCILFIDTERNWLFVCTDDTDGFPIKEYKKDQKEGMIIMDSTLVRIFLKQTGHKAPSSFYVQPTGKFYNNTLLPIMEILTNKTIEQLKKL